MALEKTFETSTQKVKIVELVSIIYFELNFDSDNLIGGKMKTTETWQTYLRHQNAYLAKIKINAAVHEVQSKVPSNVPIIQTYNVNQMQCGQSSDQENVKNVNVNKTPCNT
jgi:hypothetical protein